MNRFHQTHDTLDKNNTLFLHRKPSAELSHPQYPNQQRQEMDVKQQYYVSSMMRHSLQADYMMTRMRMPEHFSCVSPQSEELSLHRPRTIQDDLKSDVSPLQCGSIPPNLHYDPALDPMVLNHPFVPPTEITIRIKPSPITRQSRQPDYHMMTRIRIPEHISPISPLGQEYSRPAPPASQDDDAKSDVSPLQCGSVLPNQRYDPALDPMVLNQDFVPPEVITIQIRARVAVAAKQERQRTSPSPEWLKLEDYTAKKNLPDKTERSKLKLSPHLRRQRSRSLTSTDLLKQETNTSNDIPDLYRSFSEESPAVLPMGTKILLSPSSLKKNRIVVGKQSRPIYEDQMEEEAEQLSLTDVRTHNKDTMLPILHEDNERLYLSYSYSDSYQTPPTVYAESSSEYAPLDPDGVEITPIQRSSSSINESVERISEHHALHKHPRKGMVRREFQRRFLWFKKNNKSSKVNQSEESKQTITKKDKTIKTVASSLAEWKQSSGSYMV